MFTVAVGDMFEVGGVRLVGLFDNHDAALAFAETRFKNQLWRIVAIGNALES